MKLLAKHTIPIETQQLHGFITCGICKGILIQPNAITECMHVFCKKCIQKLNEPNSKCPVCQLNLGPHPEQLIRSDPILESIIFKLIPGLFERVTQVETKPAKKPKTVQDSPKIKKECLPFRVVLDKK
jgi:hypothetical protein